VRDDAQLPLFGKGQGGVARGAIFLWWFPFFYTAEKPEKSGFCAKIVQIARAGHLGK
jgi:hypothetical protein